MRFTPTLALVLSLASLGFAAPALSPDSRDLQSATVDRRSYEIAFDERDEIFDERDDLACVDVGGDLGLNLDENDIDATGGAALDANLDDTTYAKRQAAAATEPTATSAAATSATSSAPAAASTSAGPQLLLGTLLSVLGVDLQTAFDKLASEGLDLSKLGINVTSILDTPVDLLQTTPVSSDATQVVKSAAAAAPVSAATAAAAAAPVAARQNNSLDMGAILSALGISPADLEAELKAKGIDLSSLGIDLDSIYGVSGSGTMASRSVGASTKRASINIVALLQALGINLSGLGIDLPSLTSVAIPSASATAAA